MMVGNTITTSANSLWIMFMPFFFEDIGLDIIVIGFIFSFVALSRASTTLIGGRAADRFGRKPIILLGRIIYATGPMAILWSLHFVDQSPYLAGLIAVLGYIWMFAGSGLSRPASSMLLVESSPEKRRGLSFMISTRVLPSIPPAILILVGTSFYLGGLFWLALVFGVLGLSSVVILLAVGLKETLAAPESAQTEISPGGGMGSWFLLLILLAFALDGMSGSGLSWYVPIFVGDMGLYGLMIAMSTLVIAVAALGAGALVDRFGTRTAIVGGWTLLAMTVAVFPFAHQSLEILFLYSIWAGLDMVDVSVPPLIIAERYPKERRASVLGLFSTTTSLASIVGPSMVSFALLLGSGVPFFLKAAMNLTGVALFYLATRRLTPRD
jgi:MFS family permease